MDEMRIASKFMTRILSKILAVGIKKCCGVKVKIDLSNVAYTYNEGQMVRTFQFLNLQLIHNMCCYC